MKILPLNLSHPVQPTNSSDIQSIILNHSDYVNSVAFSPSEPLIASGSGDKTVRLWIAKSGEHVATLNGHRQAVWSVAFSPDGTTLASGSDDKTIKLWNVVSRKEIATLSGHDYIIYSLAFSPDGTLLTSASGDKTVRLWDLRLKTCIGIMEGHARSVGCVSFSPDCKTIASASVDKTVRLWDVGSGTCLATLQGHTSFVHSVAFSPACDQLVSASRDTTITLWDSITRAPIATLQDHSNDVHSVIFSPNGKYIASGSSDNTIKLWDVASRSIHSTLAGHSSTVGCVVFSPDGSQLASASWDNTAMLWSLPDDFSNEHSTPPQDDSSPSLSTSFDQVNDTLSSNLEKALSLSNQPSTSTLDDSPLLPFTSINLKNDVTDLVSLAGFIHIGIGGFGDVFSASHRDRGKVALKRPQKLFDNASARRFVREVDLWCSISHQYILPCLGMCKFDPYIYVVSPFIKNGDLRSCMTKGVLFNRSKILYEVAEALTHLHHRGIIHGDVKAQNVLLSDDGSALLCDFGLAKALDSMVTSTESKGTGSVRWMAPELFRNAGRSMESDVYSFGITIAEILSGGSPYSNIEDNVAVIVHVLLDNGRPPKVPLASPEGKSYSILWDTADKCWAKDAKDRPYMAQALGMLFPLARDRS